MKQVKILYVPLDERACNYRFPARLAEMTGELELLVPPAGRMGFLKRPADVEYLWDWLFQNAPSCDYAILSVDTLVYGNIINSRTHHKTKEECARLLDRFRRLKRENPRLEIHAFNLAARVAGYDSAHEDPDYWGTHGRNIWRYTFLTDKLSRGEGSEEERRERETLGQAIPSACLDDFLARREVDRFTNLACVDLTREGVFALLTVPKDDTAEYGYAAMDQQAIAAKVRAEGLMPRVLVYPGADEVGCVLLARVFCRAKGFTPRVYVRYSSTLGPAIVPKYEDRPLHESVKAQIVSAGGLWEDDAGRSDCMLAINSPGRHMIESAEQYHKDLTFSSCINMTEFLRYIRYYGDTFGKAAGLAEVSVCNGCENEFMEYARLEGVLDRVDAVGGWNTAQNTIGVVLAQTIIAAYYDRFADDAARRRLSEEFKVRSILCDWLYQSNVLHRFLTETRGKIDPYALGAHYAETAACFEENLNRLAREKFGGVWRGDALTVRNLSFDWDGVFYIHFDVALIPPSR